jgi:trk system potassium uptake protein
MLALTIAGGGGLSAGGMCAFDAINHALTTIATGGYSTRDSSFAEFPRGAIRGAGLFMWLAGLPFIRYIQLVNGEVRPLFKDVQVRAYFAGRSMRSR